MNRIRQIIFKDRIKELIFRLLPIWIMLIMMLLFVYFNKVNRIDLDGPYTVIRVIDGDTILVGTGSEEISVRLIGIDAPESVHPDETKNTPEGEAASEWLQSVLPVFSIVYLEYDVERYDKYGRTLAYVYLDDSKTMLNRLLLESGYAEIMTIPPNTKYERLFQAVEER